MIRSIETTARNHSAIIIIIIPLLIIVSIGIGNAMAEGGRKNGQRVEVGKEITITVQRANEEEDPVGAWGDGRALVVWQSTRSGPTRIYGTQVTGDGQITTPDGFPISTAPADQLFASLAWGNNHYLVVWQDLRNKRNWEIYGARVDASGRRLDPNDIPIGAGTGNRRHPVVAWNGENFLIVWMEEHPDTGWDIVGRRVASDGTLLDPGEIVISAVSSDQISPAVTWNGKNFFVAWMDGRKDRSSDIYGARIDSSGKLLDPDGIVIAAAPGEQGYPALAWNGETIIAVWVDRRDGVHHLLYGARIDPNGAVLDPNGVPVSTTPRLHMFPDIACRKHDCLVVWEEEVSSGKAITAVQDIVRDVAGLRLDISAKGLTAAPAHNPIFIAPGALGNHFSRVSTDGRRYLVVWKDYRSRLAGGFGRFVDFPEASK